MNDYNILSVCGQRDAPSYITNRRLLNRSVSCVDSTAVCTAEGMAWTFKAPQKIFNGHKASRLNAEYQKG
jgi:hypothetical protein